MNIAATATATARAVVSESSVPRFELDPRWPKPLPEGWIGGQLPCVYVDHHDNILVVNRGDITAEERETCIQAPAVMIFDRRKPDPFVGRLGCAALHPSQLRRRQRQQ